MSAFKNPIFSIITVFVVFIAIFNSSVSAQFDSADGHGGGNDSGAAYSGGIDQTDDKSAANGNDFTSNNDFSGTDSTGDGGGFSSGDNSNGGSFADYISETFGLGNEAGVDSNPGGPAPLSNQNHTIDTVGATATTDSSDTGYNCEVVNCTEPVLTGTTSCIGSVPVVNFSWTGNSTNVRYWHIVKASEPNPSFSQLISYWYTDYAGRDLVLEPNRIYYYGVFGSNSGDGNYYSGRTPLSNILAVYTPSCAPTVTAVCVDTSPSTTEDVSISWLNNEPLASGYKLYRGTNGNVSTRVYLPPNHSIDKTQYTDETVLAGTSYNYWFTSYKTIYHPPYTEITSTDENGNPTGFVDHPGYYEDIESAFSGMSSAITPKTCQPAPVTPPSISPNVLLTITTPNGTFPGDNIPVTVRQNDPVTISWQITNATDATASSNPVLSSWNGPINTLVGSTNISTSTVGTFLLSLVGTNTTGNARSSIQLNIRSSFDPYIQTTQGDVHSNKNISVPE